MNSSSSSSSSSPVTSTSVAAGLDTQLLCSSSSPPPPRPPRPQLCLQSPELQAEFLRERQNKIRTCSDSGLASPSSLTSPTSPPPSVSATPSSSPASSSSSSPSPCSSSRSARLSLSSPELLSELKQSSSESLRHIHVPKGLTTVFSGRGRPRGQDVNPSTQPANHKTSH